jgi:hypothetical protein
MGEGNQENKVGRPLAFKTPNKLKSKIKAYYKSCWAPKRDMFGNVIKDKETGEVVLVQSKPYTITGLAVFLGTSRETLMNYEARDDFFDTIKAAKEICHAYAEESLFIGKNPTGAIFNLKNNYGWKDETHNKTDLTTKGKPLSLLSALNVSNNDSSTEAEETNQEN